MSAVPPSTKSRVLPTVADPLAPLLTTILEKGAIHGDPGDMGAWSSVDSSMWLRWPLEMHLLW